MTTEFLVTDYDDSGEVFGCPDQIELDVIIKNGLLLIRELKSSIDKAGMYGNSTDVEAICTASPSHPGSFLRRRASPDIKRPVPDAVQELKSIV
jgi:hypothetical protein